ncbi:MAG: hypothetical protein AABX51_07045 [Nanoarchaeota archaeon]
MFKKQYLISLFVGLSLLLVLSGCGGSSTANPSSRCTDSDGGLNYDVAGVTSVEDSGVKTTYTDYCRTNSNLGEYNCISDNHYSGMTAYECPSGVCQNGACAASAASCSNGIKDGSETGVDCGGTCANKCGVGAGCSGASDCQSNVCTGGVCIASCAVSTYCNFNNLTQKNSDCSSTFLQTCVNGCSNGACTTAPVIPSCIDTDPSQDILVKGSVIASSVTDYDTCANVTLIQFSCNSQNQSSFSMSDCPAGNYCFDGACTTVQPPPPTCSDTDGGANLAVRGITSSTAEIRTDTCVGSSITEYYCLENTVLSISIPCVLSGYTNCVNGACV